jgi:hypothetical protein
MKKRTAKKKLTPEQFEAIRHYASLNGQYWKRELERNWKQGDYSSAVDVRTLNQIRDQFGLEWLGQYRVPAYMDLI